MCLTVTPAKEDGSGYWHFTGEAWDAVLYAPDSPATKDYLSPKSTEPKLRKPHLDGAQEAPDRSCETAQVR